MRRGDGSSFEQYCKCRFEQHMDFMGRIEWKSFMGRMEREPHMGWVDWKSYLGWMDRKPHMG
jgi:hypothetical protein